MEDKDKIKQTREQKGFSTYKLSEIMTNNGFKISQSTISKIENGNKKIDIEILRAIAKALRVPVSYLMGNSRTGMQEIIEDSLKFDKFKSIEEISEKTGISLELIKNYEAGSNYSPDDYTKVVNAAYGSYANYMNQSPSMIGKRIAENRNKEEGSINDLCSLLSRHYRITHNPTCVNSEYIEVWLKEGSDESITFTKEQFEKFIEFVVMSFPNFKLISEVICNNNKE